MKSLRLIIRNLIFIIAGIIVLLFPDASGVTLRIYGAYIIGITLYSLYLLRTSLLHMLTHVRLILFNAVPMVLRLVIGAMLLISPFANIAIVALLLGIETVLSAGGRYFMMFYHFCHFYHKRRMTVPVFAIRLTALTLTAISGVYAIISRALIAIAIALLVSGCEWIVGLLTSPAVTAKLSRLVPRIKLRLPKFNPSKSSPRPAKPAEPEDTYYVPQEYIYTDGFADKSVD